jgi:hypothetical protein
MSLLTKTNIMRNACKYLSILIFVAFSGCATKSPTQPGSLIWDYERDEVKRLDFIKKEGAISGEAMGGIFGAIAGGIIQSEIELKPNDLFRIIESALSEGSLTDEQTSTLKADSIATPRWEISESNEGQITTDWKPTKGKTVGLFRWKKEYQTEVRHIITIKRSYKSQDYSNFSIETEVRERPNANYKWAKGNPELGRSSFKEIKKILLDTIRKCAHTGRMNPIEN